MEVAPGSEVESVPTQYKPVQDLRSSLLDLDDADFDIIQSEPNIQPIPGISRTSNAPDQCALVSCNLLTAVLQSEMKDVNRLQYLTLRPPPQSDTRVATAGGSENTYRVNRSQDGPDSSGREGSSAGRPRELFLSEDMEVYLAYVASRYKPFLQ